MSSGWQDSVLHYLRDGFKILDFGCGLGRLDKRWLNMMLRRKDADK